MPAPRKTASQSDSSSGIQAAELEHAILALLAERGPGKTICPSEAARAVATANGHRSGKLPEAAWRPLMEPARAAAQRLQDAHRIVVTQRGHVVDAATAKGPIRLRLR